MTAIDPRRGRNTRAWQRVRRRVIDEEQLCWRCGLPVDKTLPGTDLWGPTADHVVPLIKGGALLDRRNLRLAHMRCNAERQAGRTVRRRVRSQVW